MTENLQRFDRPMQARAFWQQLKGELALFEGCGNMLGIVPLARAGYSPLNDPRQDAMLRARLADWGRSINSDSVMLLSGDPSRFEEQGYHFFMDVFEPRGSDESGMAGGFSTMCGNGVRAVAAYLRELHPDVASCVVMTRSGLRTVEFEDDHFIVDMGEFTVAAVDLARYVSISGREGLHHFDQPIPEAIRAQLAPYTSAARWSIGFTGNRDGEGMIDGEPHVVIQIPEDEVATIQDLRQLAIAAGPRITKNREFFPQEINVNFIVVRDRDDGTYEVWNCTHERNLGDVPEHSVTAACGTGSTVVGGVVFEQFPYVGDEIPVVCTGGTMIIKKQPGGVLHMKGPAVRVSAI
ncbi:MAG: hypothetical protein ACREGI_05085 [Candidatus Levyibacteriota bacterium]